MPKSSSSKIKIMIGSTVYGFPDQLAAICDVIESYGYEAVNSHRGTMRVDPTLSNLENCLQAVRDCDVFLGIIRPYYGSGNINGVNITFEEMKLAIKLKKPYWFLVDRDVTFARQLFRNLVPKGDAKNYELKKNHIFDMRTLDVYDYIIKNGEPPETRTGNWAQEFYRLDEALKYVKTQFEDREFIEEMVARNSSK